jgi:hypothetical protein
MPADVFGAISMQDRVERKPLIGPGGGVISRHIVLLFDF